MATARTGMAPSCAETHSAFEHSTEYKRGSAAAGRLGHSAQGSGVGSDPEPGLAQEPELF